MKKFPICIQQEARDCGVACIAMITRYYGQNYSIAELKNLCLPTREGVSLKAIASALEELGYRTVGGRVPLESLKKVGLPVILYWEQCHFVVLYQIRRIRKRVYFYIGDPAGRLIKYSQEEFEARWISTKTGGKDKGIALFITRNELFRPIKQKQQNRSKPLFQVLWPYIRQYKKFFSQLICGFVVLSAIQFAFPFLTKSIVDVGIQSASRNFILLILLAELMLLFSSTSVRMINNWIILHVSTRINLSLVSDFLIKLMKLPMSVFDTKMTGDIVGRIEDHKKIENFIVSQLLTILYSGLTGIIFSVVLFSYNLYVFFVFLTGSLIYFFWLLLFIEKRKHINYELFKQMAATNNITYQIVDGMQETKLQGCTQRRRWEWEDAKAQLFNVNIASLKLRQIQEIGSFFINESKNLIIIFLSVSAVINGGMTLGTMLAIQYIIGQLNLPIGQIISLVYNIQDVKISLERIDEIKNKEDENEGCTGHFLLRKGKIEIRDLYFKYIGTSKEVLRNIHLTIENNKHIAIVGASGSGKTTLLKLLLQYYPVTCGEIRVEGKNLNSLNRDVWRAHCSVVMQDSYIFSDSIARNIAVADEDIDLKRLRYATDMANISDFIDRLPLRYDTRIGSDGRPLSQGQKQRILIARAIYKDADYFFLDEATNSLDATNEKTIWENLQDYLKNKTVIIVAHRLSTVKNADCIVVLDDGEIVEQGTHSQLVAKKGKYYRLISNQLELGN
ncbi:MAG: peptidase domain-containing ABC transporter [Odoribacter splanchnicus]